MSPEGTLILGCPRSGTTFLRRLLTAHPRIHCPSETNVFTGCGRFLREERIVGEIPVGAVSGLEFAGIPAQETRRRLREFAFGFHRDLAKAAGKPRWAAKTAFDAFYLDEILELCGRDAAFVCILRHGLDVVCSIEELCARNGTYLEELHAYVRRWPSPREAFANVWQDLTLRLLALAEERPEQTLLVRYEDLVAEPDVTMNRIFGFLGESSDGWSLDAALTRRGDAGLGDWKAHQRSTADTGSLGRWRALPPTEVSRLGNMINPTLERAGYEAVEMMALPTPEEARRRHQIGLMLPAIPRKRE